ncbi:MAG: alpha/beta fold hydrolase [Clostridia bacterium]|nr:alpha/beta fold hydrolase [Clostridia bacterium]
MTITDDGIQLSAVLERLNEENCPLVIFFHGFTSTKDKPHTIASCEAMRETGCATLRMDMYGHGESGGEFQNHTLYKWISNALAAIRFARSLDFVTDIYLSGHSQGGLLAALVAGMEPDHVKGLILRAPAFMIPRCAREGNMLGRTFDPLHIPDEVPVIKGLSLRGEYIRVAQTIHVEEAMDRFKGPVLILHGDEDDMVPLQDSVDAAARYANCRLEIIRGESHHFDRHPDTMKEMIRTWLAKTIS